MVEKSIGLRYKMTEIGEIPEGWEISSINKTSLLKGRIGWQGLTTKEYLKNGEYYLVTGTEFKDGTIDWLKCNFVSKERYNQDSNIQIKINDILVTKDGTIGKVAFIDSLILPATLNSGVFVIRPLNNSYYPKFLYYILQSKYFKRFIGTLKAGSTISHLYQYSFSNFAFPNPPLLEQQKIAEILSDVDDLIESLDALISKKKNIKQGLMQKLLTRGIGHTLFKITDIGEIPEEWSLLPLTMLATYINGMAFKPRDWKKRGIPIVRIENLNNPYAPFNYFDGPVDNRFLLDNGDILLSWSASLGVYLWNRGKAVLNQHIFKVVPNKIINKYYLFWALHNSVENLSKVTHGSTMKHFQKGELERTKIALPPFPEQQKIAEILSDADREIEALEQKRDKYKLLKTGMMQQLLTGRIRVK